MLMRVVFLRWRLRGERQRANEALTLWGAREWGERRLGHGIARWPTGGLRVRPGLMRGGWGTRSRGHHYSCLRVRRVHMRSSWASGMLVKGMDARAV